jgi:protein-S-isoprenylcysteine O-methyltransferase Ste14
MKSQYTIVAYWSWVAIGLVWLPGYFKSKKASGVPNLAVQIPTSALLIVGFALLFNPGIHVPDLQITPHIAILGIVGLVLDLAGVGFAIWARLALGTNWAGMVMTIKQGHELVQTGPYAIVRHPIYAGFLLAMAGTAVTIGTLSCYLGLLAGLVALMIRVGLEENLMREQFDATHEAYRQRTKKLIPFVW